MRALLLLLVAAHFGCAHNQSAICKATDAEFQVSIGTSEVRFDLDGSGTVTPADFALWLKRCGR